MGKGTRSAGNPMDDALQKSFSQQISSLDDTQDEDRESDTISLAGTHFSGKSYVESAFGDRSGSAGEPSRPVYVDPVVAKKEGRQVTRSRLVVICSTGRFVGHFG
jgi:hypothetical protein